MRHTYPIRHTGDLVGTASSPNQALRVANFQARIQLLGIIAGVRTTLHVGNGRDDANGIYCSSADCCCTYRTVKKQT